jgi:hypothetical protein
MLCKAATEFMVVGGTHVPSQHVNFQKVVQVCISVDLCESVSFRKMMDPFILVAWVAHLSPTVMSCNRTLCIGLGLSAY